MRLRIDTRRASVHIARHWVKDHAHERGLSREIVEVAELLTSELVANAVLHGEGEICIDLHIDDVELTVAVTDDGDGLPIMRTTGPEVPGGHGVRIVERLATRWGVQPHDVGGKTVWFAVALGDISPTSAL